MMRLFSRNKSDSGLPKKFDGMIEAARYSPEGCLDVVRLYERRGPTWSDRVVITRDELVRRVKDGKKFVIGTRTPYMASTFSALVQVNLVDVDGKEFLTTSATPAGRDDLVEAPLF